MNRVLEKGLICTRCGSHNCTRSHRRNAEFALSVIGLLPWKCLDCRARFYARRIPWRYWPYARCPHCGNMDLSRIRRARLDFDWRVVSWLGARPVRCDACRYNFASWRLLMARGQNKVTKEVEPHAEEIDAAGTRR